MSSDSDYSPKFIEDMENSLLFQSPYLVPSFLLGYILFVTWIGPSYMKTREPFKLQKILISYNLIAVVLNAYASYWIISEAIINKHLRCLPRNHHSLRVIVEKTLLLWKFIFFNKTLELLDTVFFVLRKKKNQLTFLHVSHHSIMCFLTWWGVRNAFTYGGFYIFIFLFINSVLHCVMYSYYCVSALGPRMAKYLWWKPYLTLSQITQFVINLLYLFIEFLNGCVKLNKTEIVLILHNSLMLFLFLNFYKKSKKPELKLIFKL